MGNLEIQTHPLQIQSRFVITRSPCRLDSSKTFVDVNDRCIFDFAFDVALRRTPGMGRFRPNAARRLGHYAQVTNNRRSEELATKRRH
jgi:hypothetical protein